MFDAGSGGSDIGTFESGDDRPPERRQYTLKGVEADTIRLMRYAANKEGMKIGSWVSLRMREAAQRALAGNSALQESAAKDKEVRELPTPAPSSSDGELAEAFQHLSALWEAQLMASNDRFMKLEKELHELTSGQRTIMSALLASKC